MNSVLLMFVLLSCSQPGIIIAFSNKIMQEYIGSATESTIKYYGSPTLDQPKTYSQFWTKLEFTHLDEYFFPFVETQTVIITPTSSTTVNAQIPIQIGSHESVDITRYFIFESHPSDTHMFLMYPGLFVNVDVSFGLKGGAATISLANSSANYYFQQDGEFSFIKIGKHANVPYTGSIKSLAHQAFQEVLDAHLTTQKIIDAFNQALPGFTTSTIYSVSYNVFADYSSIKPFYFDSGFWVAEFNGSIYSPGISDGQFSTNLPHFDANKNYDYQIFISQETLQQRVRFMQLQVDISERDIGTYVYNVNCRASNLHVIIGDALIKLVYNGECNMHTSNYTLNLKYNGVHNLTTMDTYTDLILYLNSTNSQYSGQIVKIISGSGEAFQNDKSMIFSLLEEEMVETPHYISLPFPRIRCIDHFADEEINVKDGYLEVLFNLAAIHFCQGFN